MDGIVVNSLEIVGLILVWEIVCSLFSYFVFIPYGVWVIVYVLFELPYPNANVVFFKKIFFTANGR